MFALGLFSSDATIISHWSIFDSNRAVDGGGAAFRQGAHVVMRNVTLKGNEATSGGAVSIMDDAVLQLETCQMRDNVASGDGGAMFAQGRSVLNVSTALAAVA